MAKLVSLNPTWRVSYFKKTSDEKPAPRVLVSARSEDEAMQEAFVLIGEHERFDLTRTFDKSQRVPMGEFRLIQDNAPERV